MMINRKLDKGLEGKPLNLTDGKCMLPKTKDCPSCPCGVIVTDPQWDGDCYNRKLCDWFCLKNLEEIMIKSIVGTCKICGGCIECIDEITDHFLCDTCGYESQYGVEEDCCMMCGAQDLLMEVSTPEIFLDNPPTNFLCQECANKISKELDNATTPFSKKKGN